MDSRDSQDIKLGRITGKVNLGIPDRDYLDEKIEIKDVIAKYDELGFDANQDTPGNFLWEELYFASPKGNWFILD